MNKQKQEEQTKYLGVEIKNNLKWQERMCIREKIK